VGSLRARVLKAASGAPCIALGRARRLLKLPIGAQDRTGGATRVHHDKGRRQSPGPSSSVSWAPGATRYAATDLRSRPCPRYTVALAGNPNTGKSTVFNALTGLGQHTGNWPGKTVVKAEGTCLHRDTLFRIVDLPGTYSLLANSPEEQVARDFICFGGADVTAVVTDATCLERNLNLVLQVMEMTPNVVVCVNLIDEARRKEIFVDVKGLSFELGVPVVPTVARVGEGLSDLMDAIEAVATRRVRTTPLQITYSAEIEAAARDLEPHLERLLGGVFSDTSIRWFALRLIDGDPGLVVTVYERMEAVRVGGSRAQGSSRRVVAGSGMPA